MKYVHVLLVVIGVSLIVQSVGAQQIDSDGAVDRIGRSLQKPPAIQLTSPLPPLVDTVVPKRFGILTLEQPQTPGQFVSVGIPVGELIVRGVGAIAGAHHRRLERKAREEVQRELADFLAQRDRLYSPPLP